MTKTFPMHNATFVKYCDRAVLFHYVQFYGILNDSLLVVIVAKILIKWLLLMICTPTY